jgi:hypothetical protein
MKKTKKMTKQARKTPNEISNAEKYIAPCGDPLEDN